jgi:hypothetical protein
MKLSKELWRPSVCYPTMGGQQPSYIWLSTKKSRLGGCYNARTQQVAFTGDLIEESKIAFERLLRYSGHPWLVRDIAFERLLFLRIVKYELPIEVLDKAKSRPSVCCFNDLDDNLVTFWQVEQRGIACERSLLCA